MKKPELSGLKRFLEKRGIGREQLLCIAVTGLMLLLYILFGRGDSGLEEGFLLERGSYGEGDREYELFVNGLSEETERISIVLSEREYKKEEFDELCKLLAEELPAIIAPSGESLSGLSSDLYLPKSLPGYEGIRLSWYPEDTELISFEGRLSEEGIKERHDTGIDVIMEHRELENRYNYRISLVPKEYTDEELRRLELDKGIAAADEKDKTSSKVRLPSSIGGMSISYSEGRDMTPLMILAMGILFAVLLRLKPVEDEKKRKKQREEALLRDYPDIAARLLLYIGAGLTIKNSWIRICREFEETMDAKDISPGYEKQKGYLNSHSVEKLSSPLMEEMMRTMLDMEKGIPEGQAYTEFGRRCGVRCCQRLASLLEQNRKTGDKNLRALLQYEMEEAFEFRKNRALMAGQEASTKLMLPLFMSFGAVMLIVMAPSLMTLG